MNRFMRTFGPFLLGIAIVKNHEWLDCILVGAVLAMIFFGIYDDDKLDHAKKASAGKFTLTPALKPLVKLDDEIDDCCRETPEANNPYAWSKVCQYADLSVARAAFKQTPISESEIDAAEKSIKQGLAYDMPPRDLALKALTAVADLASTGPSIDLNRLRQDR